MAKLDVSLNLKTNTLRPCKFSRLELKKKKKQSIFFAVDTLLFIKTRKDNYSHGDSITMVNWALAIKKIRQPQREYGGVKMKRQWFRLKGVNTIL